jgi:hypothetical protein
MRRFVAGLLIVISAVSLLLASTSLWTRRNVVNTHVFVSNVETMVDLPQVEARVNARVTDTVMADPRVQQAIDDAVGVLPPRLQTFGSTVEDGVRSLVSAGVGRLLTNDPFRPITDAALTSAHNQLVNGQPVRFTLGQAKDRVPASARNGIAGQVLALLPDDVGVTILTPADAPQVYNAIDLLKVVWWWLGLVALATLAGALGVSRNRRGTLRAWAVTSTVLVLLALVTLRVLRGRLVVQAKPENRDALGAMYDVLAGSLRSWTLWVLAGTLLVLVLTLVWGRLGVVAAVRRGAASARVEMGRRREAAAMARLLAAEGSADGPAEGPVAGEVAGEVAGNGPTAVAGESWTRRVADGTRAFVAGLGLPEQAAHLGGFVRDHRSPARWTGIAVGAVILLFWPQPTLSVLIWIVALVALWLGALEWLQDRAPEQEAADVAAPAPDAAGGAGSAPPVSQPVSQPVSHSADQPVPNGASAASPSVVVADRVVPPAPREPEPLVSAALTPAAILTLNERLDLLVRLGAARDGGILSEEEFGREKSRLLGV